MGCLQSFVAGTSVSNKVLPFRRHVCVHFDVWLIFRVAEYLVKEAGVNVNAMNHRGDTALSLAAFWGRVSLVGLLFVLCIPDIAPEFQLGRGGGLRRASRAQSLRHLFCISRISPSLLFFAAFSLSSILTRS